MDATYIDIDDDGFPEDHEGTAWRTPDTDFQKKLLSVCKTKYFQRKSDRKSAESIEKGMKLSPPKYPPDYIDGWFLWAERKNAGRIVITSKTLISSIKSKESLARYYNRNKTEPEKGPDEYTESISW